jgi:hypothetical protein
MRTTKLDFVASIPQESFEIIALRAYATLPPRSRKIGDVARSALVVTQLGRGRIARIRCDGSRTPTDH